MTAIPSPTLMTPEGLDATTPATAAALSMELTNDGKTVLMIKTGATTANLTTTVQGRIEDGSADGITPAAQVKALLANKVYMVGPFGKKAYNNADGAVALAFSAITDITVQAFRLNQAD
jgi:hypothetical protein